MKMTECSTSCAGFQPTLVDALHLCMVVCFRFPHYDETKDEKERTILVRGSRDFKLVLASTFGLRLQATFFVSSSQPGNSFSLLIDKA